MISSQTWWPLDQRGGPISTAFHMIWKLRALNVLNTRPGLTEHVYTLKSEQQILSLSVALLNIMFEWIYWNNSRSRYLSWSMWRSALPLSGDRSSSWLRYPWSGARIVLPSSCRFIIWNQHLSVKHSSPSIISANICIIGQKQNSNYF